MSVAKARSLRKRSTPAERKLWAQLRSRAVIGFKFRRQQQFGERYLDFFCPEAKLAIELDGSGHARHQGQTADLDRDLDLYEHGIRILRFDNSDILKNLDGVINKIIYALVRSNLFGLSWNIPSPQSSPLGRGGRFQIETRSAQP